MLNKTITNALLNLRKRLILSGSDAAHHADALLAHIGVDPTSLPVRFNRSTQSRRGDTRRAVIAALADGPKRPTDIAWHMASVDPGLTYKAASARVHQALGRMLQTGRVVKDGRMWRLAQ